MVLIYFEKTYLTGAFLKYTSTATNPVTVPFPVAMAELLASPQQGLTLNVVYGVFAPGSTRAEIHLPLWCRYDICSVVKGCLL